MRFAIFAFDHYYPKGGMNDCYGTVETFEQAVEIVNNGRPDFYYGYKMAEYFDNVQIVDLQDESGRPTIVWEK